MEKEGVHSASISLTPSEYEILSLLWAHSKGLTANEINTTAKDKLWKDASIHMILDRMLSKKLITVDGFSRSGKTYGRKFKAMITPEEYALQQVEQNSTYFKNKKISGVFAALVDSKEISDETINKIEGLLKEKREKS